MATARSNVHQDQQNADLDAGRDAGIDAEGDIGPQAYYSTTDAPHIKDGGIISLDRSFRY